MNTKGLGQGKEVGRQMEPDEIKKMRRQLNDLVGRVYDLEFRLNGLVNYSEYIADNVASIINYSDFLSTRISRERRVNRSNGMQINADENIPTFTEFDRLRNGIDE